MQVFETRSFIPLATVVLAFVTGCGLGPGGGEEVTDLENEGDVYLRNAQPAGEPPECEVEPGEVEVEVVFNSCASSSCTTLEEAECTAVRDGDEIEITSSARIRNKTGNVACTTDCGILSVRCDVGTLEEGTYTLAHGDDTRTVAVPGEEDYCY